MTRAGSALRCAPLALLLAWPLSATTAAAEGSRPAKDTYDLRGYVDLRAVLTDDTVSWIDRGLGKAPWGNGDDELIGRVAEGVLVGTARLGWSTTGVLQLQYHDAQDHPVDVAEAYLRFKPVSTGASAFDGRLGVFVPPGSFENSAVGWSSPYTLTSSAINSWLGEEFRLLGGEAGVTFRRQSVEARLGAAVFFGGDPQGTQLAWRGWAIHDRELGLFDDWPLAPLDFLPPNPGFDGQSDRNRPLDEIDHRPGFLVTAEVGSTAGRKLHAMYYDNRTDPEAFDAEHGQFGWHTHFYMMGGQWDMPGEVTLLGQTIFDGRTAWGPKIPVYRVTDVDFDAAYLLASKSFGAHRASIRYDWFRTHDLDTLAFLDNNNERGRAWTAAWIWRPAPHHRLTAELLHIMSRRTERLDLGLPERADETTVQLSYRWLFELL